MCALFLAAQFNLLSAQTTVMKVWKGGNVTSSISTADVDSVTFETNKSGLDDGVYLINGHKFVDLGLPSGLLWAEANIGAETAYDDGDYYAWGETSSKNEYTLDNYKHYTVDTIYNELYETYSYTEYYTKYNETDRKTVLDKEDDAAYVNWGASCRMPTYDEWCELTNSDNCIWVWVSRTNSSGEMINCYKVVSKKNNNIIYLPASGYRYESYLYNHGSLGSCWSSTLYSNYTSYACSLYFNSGGFGSDGDYRRYVGHTVRPVAAP